MPKKVFLKPVSHCKGFGGRVPQLTSGENWGGVNCDLGATPQRKAVSNNLHAPVIMPCAGVPACAREHGPCERMTSHHRWLKSDREKGKPIKKNFSIKNNFPQKSKNNFFSQSKKFPFKKKLSLPVYKQA